MKLLPTAALYVQRRQQAIRDAAPAARQRIIDNVARGGVGHPNDIALVEQASQLDAAR